ncbi:uncharacterized protein V1516DRAFT_664966 [Lipomyces oligophaga]|uniref:uncharacterized protein n=1 Tax=Lipomyces oligophaga TaxID=45792 RepID=UPI0034CDD1E4
MNKSRKTARETVASDARRTNRAVAISSSVEDSPEPENRIRLIKVSGLPADETKANYEYLNAPVGVDEAQVLAVSLERSRRTWLTGCAFETFWSRPQRGRKNGDGQNARDRMSKFCECRAQIGPHIFDLRLFTAKDESQKYESAAPAGSSASTNGSPGLTVVSSPSQGNIPASATNITSKLPEPENQSHAERSDLPLSAEGRTDNTATPNSPPADVSRASKNTEIMPTSQENLSTNRQSLQTSKSANEPMSTSSSINISPASDLKPGSDALAPLNNPSTSHVLSEPVPQSTPEIETHASQPVSQQPISGASVTPNTTSSIASSRPMTPVAPQPPRHPNENLINRLHALARADAAFGDLMRLVASGKASAAQIREFQIYINQNSNKEPIMTYGSSVRPTTPIYRPVQRPIPSPRPRSEPKRKEREIPRDQTLVFEFRETPNDRYLFPKLSLLDSLPDGSINVLFLVLSGDPPELVEEPTETGLEKKTKKRKKSSVHTSEEHRKVELKYYTPVRIRLLGISRRLHESFLRAVKPRQEVLDHMRKITATLQHSKDFWIYYDVDAKDTELLDKSVEPIGINHPNLKKRPWSSIKDKDKEVEESVVFIKHVPL